MSLSAQDLAVIVDGEAVPLVPASADPLVRAVIISLFTWRRARPDDVLPSPGMSRMGWWGDSHATVAGDRIGSRLWLLARRALTPQTVNEARGMAEEALAWLVEDGVASSVEVTAERSGLHGLSLACRIARTDGSVRELRFADAWAAIHG